MAAEIEFCLLGPLMVRRGGVVVPLPPGKQRTVLAALLLNAGDVVSLDELAEVLWGASPPPSARVTIQNYVMRLRKALGSASSRISTQPRGYLIRADAGELDESRFRAHLDAAGAAARNRSWQAAATEARAGLALWRGEPLADVESELLAARDAPRLAELRLRALEIGIDADLHLGRHAQVITGLRQLTGANPLRERLHGMLMLALYRDGCQAEALAAYQHVRGVLVSELGVEPGPDLQDLHQRILSADPALAITETEPPAEAEPVRDVPRELPETQDAQRGGGHLLVTSPGVAPGPELQPLYQDMLRGDAGDDADARDGAPRTAVTSGQTQLDKAARELATAVARQWTAEAVMRSLGRPEPIQLRWSSTRRTAAVAPNAMVGCDPGTAEAMPNLHGGLSDLIAKFRQLPKRRLVVLGEPGAGKTALAVLLTLGLLSNPDPREPVPVLLPLSSWDPRNEHLYTWLARKLTEEYPGLGNAAAYGPHAAQRLVADERVMPVLDGLDEMPPELQAAAIDAIDLATAGGRRLVVTCRSAEYEEAVLRGGVTLAASTVVEMQPVDIEGAARFLTARQPPGHSGWRPVVEHLRRHPRGPLAHVMSTPLMLDLARTAYSGRPRDPAELTDAVLFPDRASIEEHLLDEFLPAAYPQQVPRLSSAAGIRPVALLQYKPEQAGRWLTLLAQLLHSTRTGDLAWWRLAEAIPQPVRGLIFAFPPALIFAITGELAGGHRTGIVYGVAFALAGFAVSIQGRRPGPLRVELRFRGTGPRFLRRFAIGLAIGVVLGLGWSLSGGLVLVLGLIFGMALGVHVWLDTPVDASRVSSPVTVLRQERTAALSYTFSFALSMGTFYAVADTFTKEIRFVPVLTGSFDIALGLATGIAGALMGQFAFGRSGGVAYGMAAAAVGGLVFPRASTPFAGLLAGTMFGIAVGCTFLVSRAWGSFVIAYAWLAAQGKLPLRLMPFLADAHRRGVLRQAGAVYQFRHARLQDNLANRRDG